MPIIPTPGTDAAAAGMDLVPGGGGASDLDEYINQTRDYIAQRTAAVAPVAKGGTGQTSIAAARNAFGLGNTAGALPVANGGTGATSAGAARTALGITAANVPSTGSNVQADIDYLNSIKFDKAGGTVTGNATFSAGIYNAPPAATFSYTIAYWNGDNRLCKGASSARFKDEITRSPQIPDVFAVPLSSFIMRQDPTETLRYGYIAEDLAANPATAGFVVNDEDGEPESYDMIGFLLAQNALLHARVAALEAAS